MEDWNETARSIGFKDEKSMLESFYTDDGMSVAEIASRLGAGTATIARRLTLCKVKKRSRGGSNNLMLQRRKLFHLDPRLLMYSPLDKIAEMCGGSKSTVYKFRRALMGVKSGVLRNSADLGFEEVRESEQKTSAASTGE